MPWWWRSVKSFSACAGMLALALIVIPVVIRTTENMLMLVPAGLREAAYALGTPKWKVITMVTLRAARAGVITGVLLAVARIAGETAPLLFTALNNQFWNGRPVQAHGQPAGDHLQVCHEPLRELAAAGLGWRVPRSPWRCWASTSWPARSCAIKPQGFASMSSTHR